MHFLTALQKWIEAMDFGSDEKNRMAEYVQGLSIIIIVSALLLTINYATTDELVVGLLVGSALVFGLVLILVRKKHLELAKFLFVSSGLLLLTFGLIMKNGIRGAGAFMYPVLLIFAGVLLTRRAFILFVVFTLANVGAVIFAENRGALLIQHFDPPDITLFITFAWMISMTAVIIRFVTESWQNSLKRMEQTQAELKKQQVLLEASEARWRTLIVHAPALIATVNRDGTIKFVNAEYREQLTGSPERTIYEFLDPNFRSFARQTLETCFATGQPGHYEVSTSEIDPASSWYSIGLGPVIENGTVVEVILIATDITRQKQAEAEVRQFNEELDQRVRTRSDEVEAAYRELEMFSYAVSHNLRTPARGMTGFSEMLIRDYAEQLDPSARNLLRRISTNAITMGLMIDDLLEFLQLGRVPLKVRDVSPTMLAQNALESLPAYRDAHGITFTIEPMPRVQADANLLARVYSNLLDNAIKFTRNRKDAIIHVGVTQTEKGPAFFVKDNGIGFDMQYVDKLFGVFQQLHRPGEYEGTGVGLATVQRIIRRHGGQVWAEAELNRGAIFYFTL